MRPKHKKHKVQYILQIAINLSSSLIGKALDVLFNNLRFGEKKCRRFSYNEIRIINSCVPFFLLYLTLPTV